MTGPAAPRPGISVVLPVRDDAPALRRCLEALARQDRPADEIVVVDNGSSDDLLAVIAAAERDQDLPLRLLQEPRPGVSFAAHAGYDAASHEIIARCDADSIPPSSWLGRIERQLAAEDDKLVAITGVGRFAPGPRALGRSLCGLYLGLYRLASGLALAHPPLWGSNMAMRTSWWNRVSPRLAPRPSIHDDFELSFELQPHEAIALDRGSVMPVSWRAAVSPRRLLAQQRMARRLLLRRWEQEPPWERHRRRWAGRRSPL